MILLLAHQRPDGDTDTYHLKPGRRYHIGRGSGCEVRILDLKLSRKHAAVEYSDDRWRFLDLGSTNGCTVDGVLADDPTPLKVGSVIALGQTTLQVAELVDPLEVVEAVAAPVGAVEAVLPSAKPVHRKEPSNEFPPVELETAAEPPQREPLTAIKSASRVAPDASAPLAEEAPRSGSSRVGAQAVPLAAMPPITIPAPLASAAASTVLADPADRPFFITVLGTRVGPLTKAEARDLKARELKGLLKPEDLAGLPKA